MCNMTGTVAANLPTPNANQTAGGGSAPSALGDVPSTPPAPDTQQLQKAMDAFTRALAAFTQIMQGQAAVGSEPTRDTTTAGGGQQPTDTAAPTPTQAPENTA
ncbi:MAG: hypothetical protein JWN41_1390, partial [Thermoleophilia bacterium]|nr:hypothetical protein [Thermoleophilia bacterium]